MAFTTIPTTDIDQDSPITQTLMTAFRDNILTCTRLLESPTDLSSDATADFVLDSASFDNYAFVLQNVIPVSDAVNLFMRTSTDGGSSYDAASTNYNWSNITSDTTSGTPANGGSATIGTTAIYLASSIGSAAGESGFSGVVWLYGPHLAQNTRVSWHGGYTSSAGVLNYSSGAGERASAADVDAVRFVFSSGNMESGTISAFGWSVD